MEGCRVSPRVISETEPWFGPFSVPTAIYVNGERPMFVTPYGIFRYRLQLAAAEGMGLSNFPSAGDGLLPAMVVSKIFWVDLVKGLLRSCLQIAPVSGGLETAGGCGESYGRVQFTRFKALCGGLRPWSGGGNCSECCVCLCGFGEEEEVSELSCRHLFHRRCLEKWFGNSQRTCPLCRRFVI